MEIKSYTIGPASKVVTVSAPMLEMVAQDKIVEFAMAHAGEYPNNLFGYRVKYLDDFSGEKSRKVAQVTLYTD